MRNGGMKLYILILKIIFLAFIFLNAYQIYAAKPALLAVFWIAATGLAANDIIRKVRGTEKAAGVSLLVSIAGAAAMKYFVPGIGSTVYIFVPLFELFYLNISRMKVLIAVHAAAYFTAALITGFPFDAGKLPDAGISILLYLGVAGMSYLLYSVRREKEEVKKLNLDLTAYNEKLAEYSRRVEELTRAAERSRVAQELHDTLGHSLMALSMNLEYAEKICDSRPDEVKKVIVKAKEISKKGVSDLRDAVHTLRDERRERGLRESIHELADNFCRLEKVDIRFSMDSELEDMDPDMKNCIYKTVLEGLTNGLRHGNATFFDIRAGLDGDLAWLSIKDNGCGCSEVIESFGLNGISERVSALGGAVRYHNGNEGGFQIEAEIPVPKEMVRND